MSNSRDRQIEDGMGFAGLVGENCRDCVSYQKELARKNRRIAELEAERDALKANYQYCLSFVHDTLIDEDALKHFLEHLPSGTLERAS